MKKILIFLLIPLVLGTAGFFAGRFFSPPPAPKPAVDAVQVTPKLTLYKMPLGKFTIQVLQPGRILHLVVDVDVYLAGAMAFDELNGAHGKARLRDAVVAIGSELAETTLWIKEGTEDQLDREQIAEQIVRKLHRSFPSVRTARLNSLNATRSTRY